MTGFCPLFVHFFFCTEGENDILTMFLSYFLLSPLTPQKSIFSDVTENLMNTFYQELRGDRHSEGDDETTPLRGAAVACEPSNF